MALEKVVSAIKAKKQQGASKPAPANNKTATNKPLAINNGRNNTVSIFNRNTSNGTKVNRNDFTSHLKSVTGSQEGNEEDDKIINTIWNILDADNSGEIDDSEYDAAIKYFGSDSDGDGENDDIKVEDMVELLNIDDGDEAIEDFQQTMISQYAYLKETGNTNLSLEEYLSASLNTDEFISYFMADGTSEEEARELVSGFIEETLQFAEQSNVQNTEHVESEEEKSVDFLNSQNEELQKMLGGLGIMKTKDGGVIFNGTVFKGAYATDGTKAILDYLGVDLDDYPQIKDARKGTDLKKISSPIQEGEELLAGDTVVTGEGNSNIHSGVIVGFNQETGKYIVAEANSDKNGGGFVLNEYSIGGDGKCIQSVIRTSPIRQAQEETTENTVLTALLNDGETTTVRPVNQYHPGLHTSPLEYSYTLSANGREYATIIPAEDLEYFSGQIQQYGCDNIGYGGSVGNENRSGHCLDYATLYGKFMAEGNFDLSRQDEIDGANQQYLKYFNGGRTQEFENEQEMYAVIYAQISQGIPVIMQVAAGKGDGIHQHFVTICGISKEAQERGYIESASDLLIIDSYDGHIEGMRDSSSAPSMEDASRYPYKDYGTFEIVLMSPDYIEQLDNGEPVMTESSIASVQISNAATATSETTVQAAQEAAEIAPDETQGAVEEVAQAAVEEALQGGISEHENIINIIENKLDATGKNGVMQIDKGELETILGVKFNNAWAAQGAIAIAQKLNPENVFVRAITAEGINSSKGLKNSEYMEDVDENTELNPGDLVIMQNPDGTNVHCGIFKGIDDQGRRIVIECNSDDSKDGNGCAVVAYPDENGKDIIGVIRTGIPFEPKTIEKSDIPEEILDNMSSVMQINDDVTIKTTIQGGYITTSTENGKTIENEFDSKGNIIKQTKTDESGITEFEYDGNGKYTKAVEKDSNGDIIKITSYEYDGNGNKTSVVVTNAQGARLQCREYDGKGGYTRIEYMIDEETGEQITDADGNPLRKNYCEYAREGDEYPIAYETYENGKRIARYEYKDGKLTKIKMTNRIEYYNENGTRIKMQTQGDDLFSYMSQCEPYTNLNSVLLNNNMEINTSQPIMWKLDSVIFTARDGKQYIYNIAAGTIELQEE